MANDEHPPFEPSWVEKYPEKFRALLNSFGKEDNGDEALIAFNRKLCEVAEVCKSKREFDYAVGSLYSTWSPVLRAYGPRIGSRGPDEIEMHFLGIDEDDDSPRGWFSEKAPSPISPCDLQSPRDRCAAFDAWGGPRYCEVLSGVSFTEQTLLRLQRVGRGPIADGRLGYSECDRWLVHAFGIRIPDDAVFGLPARANLPATRSWLYIAPPSPDADQMKEMLESFGVTVHHSEDELSGARSASTGAFAGAILDIGHNVEATCVIADLLLRRQIPFLILSMGGEIPARFVIGGELLTKPLPHEIRATLQRRFALN